VYKHNQICAYIYIYRNIHGSISKWTARCSSAHNVCVYIRTRTDQTQKNTDTDTYIHICARTKAIPGRLHAGGRPRCVRVLSCSTLRARAHIFRATCRWVLAFHAGQARGARLGCRIFTCNYLVSHDMHMYTYALLSLFLYVYIHMYVYIYLPT